LAVESDRVWRTVAYIGRDASGKWTVNVEPSPGVLAQHMCPPCWLLGSVPVGRIVFTARALPAICP